ncbi:MAG: 16S rRNA (guanine(527)-N(7))-methyltransferase RsmG [Inquilinus sp.]|nr:16S rRNA (guanine(527)-N(7))-methyltransferase RsmG [Inquilinus sp.]
MSAEAFAAASDVSRETLEKLIRYLALLEKWQRRINLVGRSTLADPWRRHMLDSAQLLPLLPEGARILVDLGSGAGFPGMVLAILGVPEVHLIESDGRKAAFLGEVSRETSTPVTIHAARIEDVRPFVADVVTARALAPLPDLVELARRFSDSRTVWLFPKGQDVDRELTATTKEANMRLERVPSRAHPSAVILRLTRTDGD